MTKCGGDKREVVGRLCVNPDTECLNEPGAELESKFHDWANTGTDLKRNSTTPFDCF